MIKKIYEYNNNELIFILFLYTLKIKRIVILNVKDLSIEAQVIFI